MSWRVLTTVVILAGAAAGIVAIDQCTRTKNPRPADLVTVEVKGASVDHFLVKVAESAGRQITILGDSGNADISADIKDGKLADVLTHACEAYGCTWKITPEGRLVVAWPHRTGDAP